MRPIQIGCCKSSGVFALHDTDTDTDTETETDINTDKLAQNAMLMSVSLQ